MGLNRLYLDLGLARTFCQHKRGSAWPGEHDGMRESRAQGLGVTAITRAPATMAIANAAR
jgi:hypothetical protein